MIDLDRCPACDAVLAPSRILRELAVPETPGTPATTVQLGDCGACEHVFLNPQPTVEELAPYYGGDYSVYVGRQAEREALAEKVAEGRRTGRCGPAPVIRGHRYLDVGCGQGNLVYVMGELGMDAEGVELSAAGVAKARRLGVPVFHGTIQEAAYPDEHFRVVTMMHVLEHVHDPVGTLEECRRVLHPAGEMIVAVPNFESTIHRLSGDDWFALDPPRHIHHFSRRSLRTLVERAGFVVAAVRTHTDPGFFEDWMVRWARSRIGVPEGLARRSRMFHPAAAALTWVSDRRDHGEELVVHLRPH